MLYAVLYVIQGIMYQIMVASLVQEDIIQMLMIHLIVMNAQQAHIQHQLIHIVHIVPLEHIQEKLVIYVFHAQQALLMIVKALKFALIAQQGLIRCQEHQHAIIAQEEHILLMVQLFVSHVQQDNIQSQEKLLINA